MDSNIEYIKSVWSENRAYGGDQVKWAQETIVEIRNKLEEIDNSCSSENRAMTDQERQFWKDAVLRIEELRKIVKKEEDTIAQLDGDRTDFGIAQKSENGKIVKVYSREDIVNRNAPQLDGSKPGLGRFLQLAGGASPQSESEERALSEGTDSAGGYLAPAYTSSTLIEGLYNYSTVFEAGAQIVDLSDITADSFSYAKVSSTPTVSWFGENSTISESDPAFGTVIFTPKKGAFIFYASNELLLDTPNARQKLQELCQRAAAEAIDQGALIGTGASNQPTGIVNQSGLNTVSFGTNGSAPTSFDEMVDAYYEIANAKGSLPSAAIMHPRTFRDYGKLKDTQNQPLMRPSVIENIRLLQSQAISTTLDQGTSTGVASEAIVGDFSKLWIGMRLRPNVFVDPYSSSNKDQVMFRLTFRMDVQIENPEHFTLLQGILSA